MRVFLDSNVLVSGLGTRGLCADFVELTLMQHDLITSDAVIEEVRSVLVEKFKMWPARAAAVERQFRSYEVVSAPDSLLTVTLRDASDLPVLAAALHGQADVLVTGDRDLLSVADQVSALDIVTPRAFWERFRVS